MTRCDGIGCSGGSGEAGGGPGGRPPRGRPLLSLAILSATPPALAAQGKIAFEGQGGVTLPTGRLADVVDPGPGAGLQLAYQLSPRISLALDGGLDALNGAALGPGTRAPDMRLWRYGGGLSANLLPEGRWALVTSAGAGATRFSSDEFSLAGATESSRFRHTYFTSNAGLKLGYALGPGVTTYVGARGVWAATSETDTEVLAALDPSVVRPFGSAVTVPVSVGLNVKFGGRKPSRTEASSGPAPRAASPASEDRGRRETEARRLCEEAEAALEAGEYDRARGLYRRAKAEYPGTLCAEAADVQLEKVSAVETIRERVHFEFDRYRITDQAAETLRRKAEVLRKHPRLRVLVEGHCDERGSLEYNQVLGKRRAESTVRFLVSLGLPGEMFETVSFGKERPLKAGAGEAVWSANRRAEFVVRNLGAL